jgi:hypothetical protein
LCGIRLLRGELQVGSSLGGCGCDYFSFGLIREVSGFGSVEVVRMVCWGIVGCCVLDAVMRWFLLCAVEGLECEVNPLAALLMLQSLLLAGCSFPQFGHLSCGHGEWVSAHSRHVWSHLWCVSPHRLHLYCEVHMLVLCVRL